MKRVMLFSFFYIVSQGTTYAAVVLTWVDNSDNENGFVIERTLSSDCSDGWEVIGYTDANQNSFTDIEIPGACYRVAAYNDGGLSSYSNIAQFSNIAEVPSRQKKRSASR